MGGAAWHYDNNELAPDDRRTWSQWRGYSRVKVHHGDPTLTTPSTSEYLYFRGMDGDTLPNGGIRHASVTDSEGTVSPDADQFRGFLREEIHYNGSAVVTGTINTPVSLGPTATRGEFTAFIVQTRKVRTRTALSAGGFRRTEVDTTFNDQGVPTTSDDLGDTAISTDDQCTRYTYARNTSAWMLTYPSRVETNAVACTGTPTFPDDAISDTRTSYDGGAFGTPPTHGDVTKIEELNTHPSTGPTYVTTYRGTFDQYGRPKDSFDALDHKTTTTYTPATGGPVTSVKTTNPLGHTNSTTLDPAWGLPTSTVDANNKRTDLTYDAMGRLTAVWLPGESKSVGLADAQVSFSYLIRKNGPVAVETKTLMPTGSHTTSYTLYDSRLRPRQTQAPAPGGGRLLTDTFYDSRGLVTKQYGAYYNDDPPTNSLLAVADNVVPNQTVTSFDNAERPVASIFRIRGVEQWRTTTTYGGDRVNVDPPEGATATTTISDARGNTTELRQYHGGAPTGAFDATTYTYTPAGQLATLTDPAGNTWNYTYDPRGRRIQSDDPDKGVSTSTYDDLGQITTSTDSRGDTLAYTYDALGRKTAVREGSSTGPIVSEWTYDTLAKGQLTSSTRHEDGGAYTAQVTGYNDRYQPTGSTITIPSTEGALAGSYHTDTTYRLNGAVHTTTLPAAGGLPDETLTYAYNSVGLPTTTRGISTYVIDSAYSKYGEPLEYTLDAGGLESWLLYYYQEGTRRLDEAITERESSNATQSDAHYTYDPAGNITTIANTPPSLAADVQCFDYDYLRRLTQAWTSTNDCATAPSTGVIGGPAPYWTSYTYDTTGNRLTQTDHDPAGDTTHTYAYPDPGQPHPHALESVTASGPGGTSVDTYGYDDAGNTTSRDIAGDTQTLEWGTEGHLESTDSPSGDTSYVYNTEGARLIRHDTTGSTLYLGAMELHADIAGNTTATRYYTHNGTTIAQRTPQGLNWLGTDHHATPDLAINEATLTPTHRYFDPYGNPRGPDVTWPDDHGYLGAPTDPTGLTHLGAREYDPTTGRFIAADPLLSTQNPQQLNGYSYANNNPATFADPTGQLCTNGPDGMCKPVSGHNGQKDPPFVSSGISQVISKPQRYRLPHGTTYQDDGHTKTVNGLTYSGDRVGDYARELDAAIAWEVNKYSLVDYGSDLDIARIMFETCESHLGELCDGDFYDKLDHNLLVAQLNAGLGVGNDASGGDQRIGSVGDRSGPPCNSFLPDTQVLLADGTHKAIDELKLGDEVVVTDLDDELTTTSAIVGTIIGNGDKDLIRITVTNEGGVESTLTATDTHPFWVEDQSVRQGPNIPSGHWTEASKLEPGDRLHSSNGIPVTVAGVSGYTAHRIVYNLTIDRIHTFYVRIGLSDILVHNCPESRAPIVSRWASRRNLEEHFDRHGASMGYESQAEYEYGAYDLMYPDREGVRVKQDGTNMYYLDPRTGEFGMTGEGRVVTFYIPDNPIEYFERMPGGEIGH